jgi:hypothetical protein
MTTVVNGHDAALWSADAVPDAAAGRAAETARRDHRARSARARARARAARARAAGAGTARVGAHRAGDLVWARICLGVTLALLTGALLVLASVAYRSVS